MPNSSIASTSGASTSTQSAPLRLLGNWQLEQLAHHGAVTNVYFARPLGCPPTWPADYVVKVLKADFNDDATGQSIIQREAEVGRHSSHPNLVPILDAQMETSPYHVVMPRLKGASLKEVICQVGQIVVPHALWLARQVAQGLKHLHLQGWIHGDVKPANIMVSLDGHATLIDLGAALRPDESIYCPSRPMLSTMHYVAPEMLISCNTTGSASDVYALGISLYQMLSGRLPFDHECCSRLVEAHLRQQPPPLPNNSGVTNPVNALVMAMLAKSPMRRPTVDELIQQLAALEIATLHGRMLSNSALSPKLMDSH